jgi:uncharacterized membrane protein HdeD (DUF308 family)
MIFLPLVFAHLLGDFVLQPTKLIKFKLKSAWGVLIHVLVHILLNILVLLPFLNTNNLYLLWFVFIIGFSHYFFDRAKIIYEKKYGKSHKKPSIWPFLVDQLLHFAVLGLVAFTWPQSAIEPYYNNFLLTYFISLILLTKGFDIYLYQSVKHKKNTLVFNHKRQIKRVIVFSAIYLALYFATRA